MAPTKLESRIPERVIHPPVDAPEEAVIAEVGEALASAASSRRPPILDETARQAARRAAVDLATAALTASSAETAAHSDDVDIIAEGIGRRLGLSEQQLDDVMVAARLHDIGKLGVPQAIIEKPAALDASEWAVIKRHTIIGEQILLAVPELRSAARLVRHSHERWDGGGYPDRLAGEQIPIGSRIVFCADAYHAIRSNRAYRAGRPATEALAEIRRCAGTQFDPAVVDALEDLSEALRATRAGHRAAFGRSRRLMALMLVVSVGFTGSAIARSGVMPEAKLPRPAAPAVPAANPTGAPGATGGPVASAVTGVALGKSTEQGKNARYLALTLAPGLSLAPGTPASLGIAPGTPIGAGDASGTDSGTDAPGTEEQPGVRDHGLGIGNGKGQGKGHGAENGLGHQKPKAEKQPKGASNHGSGKGSGNSSNADSQSSSSNSSSHSSAGTKSKSSGSSGSTKKSSSGSSGSTSSGSGSSGSTNSGSDKAPKPPKPSKAPNAPKPPKAAPTPPEATAPVPGANVGGSTGTGGSTSVEGSASGPGNGHGNGHG